jgi:hypothetical protein
VTEVRMQFRPDPEVKRKLMNTVVRKEWLLRITGRSKHQIILTCPMLSDGKWQSKKWCRVQTLEFLDWLFGICNLFGYLPIYYNWLRRCYYNFFIFSGFWRQSNTAAIVIIFCSFQ